LGVLASRNWWRERGIILNVEVITMALFIRKRPQERCSPAEIEVAELLTELDDRWLIRWGFIYRDNHGTPREGDFLISGPDGGLLVLEVKAGPVSLNPYTGQWSTADGDDPSEQLHAEYTGVKQALEDHQGQQPSVYVGRALGAPHLTLKPGTESHHGIPREYLFDRRDLRQFAKTWTERMRQWNAHLNRTDREVLERAFGAEGSPKSIRTFIDDIDRALFRHTDAGFVILDQLARNHRFLVSGGAGTGKTWIALDLARRWAADNGWRVLFLGYNLGFTTEIRSMVERLHAQRRVPQGEITVWSWEGLVQTLFKDAEIPYEPPESPEDRRKFFEVEVPSLLQDVLAGGHVQQRFDAVIVDEAQDHDTSPTITDPNHPGGSWWPVYFRMLLKGTRAPVAVFHDTAQRPSFRAGKFDVDQLLATWCEEPVRIQLIQCLRYTRQIHSYLQGLDCPSLKELVAGLGAPPAWSQGVDVEQVEAPPNGTPACVAEIVSRWVVQGWARPEQILILSRRGSLERSSLKGLAELGDHPLVETFHPDRGTIGFGSVNRAKGLDRLAVIVIDFPGWRTIPDNDRIPFFMGVSRARQLLAVVGLS
jgi:hypothetical protein